MDYSTPNSYKNFLPSKRFQLFLLIIIIVAAAIIGIPKIVAYIQHRKEEAVAQKTLLVQPGTGSDDPTTRSSDGSGIPDWEEILVGLDPHNPETIPGVPNAVAFERIEAKIGISAFNQEISQVDDTDKLSLAMYDDLSSDADQNGQTTNGSVVNITQTEILNYVVARKAQNKTYSAKDLTVVDDTSANVQKFFTLTKKATSSLDDSTLTQHISDYINGKESKDQYFTGKIKQINDSIQALLAIPVPSTAVPIYLDSLNALYGMSQTLDAYQPTDTNDTLSEFGTIGLLEDYINAAGTANQDLGEYFSVVLPNANTK